MKRVKNYIAKTIYARVTGYGVGQNYAHIYVPSHWMDQDVSLRQYTNGKTVGKAKVKQFSKTVKNYNKMSCHIPLSNVFIGDIFEITLDNHKELMANMFENNLLSHT